MMKHKLILLICALMGIATADAQRIEMSIAGKWKTPLGVCNLPGTTDENKLGDGKHTKEVTSQLTRLFPYTGCLSYEREIEITNEMAKKSHQWLYIERTKPSKLWVDGVLMGYKSQLYAPHIYHLFPKLNAGKHTIKIEIDNRDEVVPQSVRGSHAWTDATQTNWNGILGDFKIIATDGVYISKTNVYPDANNKTAKVKLHVIADKKTKATITLNCIDNKQILTTLSKGTNELEYDITLGDNVLLWSEFHPNLYTITTSVEGKGFNDTKSIRFGVRTFATEGTQLTINGYKTFLRGTHDACVFPLTGYSPTDVNEWRHLFKRAKEYGINHFRFHSYTPTEAAFIAADEMGIYLQTELPLWGTIDSTTIEQNKFLLNEAHSAIEFLGNHPSFMSLGLGNELWGDFNIMRTWLDEFREQDNRHLYVYGSNNTLGWQGVHDGEDYFVTCRVGGGDHYKTNTRTSFSFADEDDGGILNHVRPNTRDNFSYPVSLCPRPIVAHETCQFQMYPRYSQIEKYKGVLHPYNLEIFHNRLKENGLENQAEAFADASEKWGLECYKADIEYCLRTRSFGGYQLLDLKDYPGQGSALCGILNAFMEQKNEADKKVANVMQPIVPLLIMDKYCWSTNEPFKFDISVANYSEDITCNYVELTFEVDGKKEGITYICHACHPGNTHRAVLFSENGEIEELNNIISEIKTPKKATITLETGNHKSTQKYINVYNVWFYPENPNTHCLHCNDAFVPKGIVLADTLDNKVIKALKKGKTILLTPTFPSIEKQSVGGLFTPDYWNFAMFKTISENNNKPISPGTLGMMMPDGAAKKFTKNFPLHEDGHTDWNMWAIAKNSRPLILNSLHKDYHPLIQTIDNIERNHKLGILMEFRVGKGKLLISTTDLEAISDYVEGRAFRNAIVQYAASNEFNPNYYTTIDELRALLYSETKIRDIQGVKNITDYKNE